MADNFSIVIAGLTLTASVQLSYLAPVIIGVKGKSVICHHTPMVYHVLQITLYEILCSGSYYGYLFSYGVKCYLFFIMYILVP